MSQGLSKRTPRGQLWTASLRKVNFLVEMIAQRVDFKSYFGSQNCFKSMQKSMPNKLRNRYQKGTQMEAKSIFKIIKNLCRNCYRKI